MVIKTRTGKKARLKLIICWRVKRWSGRLNLSGSRQWYFEFVRAGMTRMIPVSSQRPGISNVSSLSLFSSSLILLFIPRLTCKAYLSLPPPALLSLVFGKKALPKIDGYDTPQSFFNIGILSHYACIMTCIALSPPIWVSKFSASQWPSL